MTKIAESRLHRAREYLEEAEIILSERIGR